MNTAAMCHFYKVLEVCGGGEKAGGEGLPMPPVDSPLFLRSKLNHPVAMRKCM